MAAARKIRRAQLSRISAEVCLSALSCALDWLLRQFCLIMHPHGVAAPFSATFALPEQGTAEISERATVHTHTHTHIPHTHPIHTSFDRIE